MQIVSKANHVCLLCLTRMELTTVFCSMPPWLRSRWIFTPIKTVHCGCAPPLLCHCMPAPCLHFIPGSLLSGGGWRGHGLGGGGIFACIFEAFTCIFEAPTFITSHILLFLCFLAFCWMRHSRSTFDQAPEKYSEVEVVLWM